MPAVRDRFRLRREPIKHARRTRGQHRRYYGFADYGDAERFRKKMTEVTDSRTRSAANR